MSQNVFAFNFTSSNFTDEGDIFTIPTQAPSTMEEYGEPFFFDVWTYIFAIILIIRCIQNTRESREEDRSNTFEEATEEERRDRMEEINSRFDFTTLQKDDKPTTSTEVASGSTENSTNDELADSKSFSSERLVSAFSSFLASVRSIGRDPQTQEECCSICLEAYREGDVVATLKPSCESTCQHQFHKDCILEWLQNHNECPMCRATMVGSE